jgi:hypothetical protein
MAIGTNRGQTMQLTRRQLTQAAASTLVGLAGFSFIGCGKGTSNTTQNVLKYVDAALAAADGFVAEFGTAIPAPYGSYVNAGLDGLNFVATELQKTPALTWSQIVSDTLKQLVPLEVTDLTGLNVHQVRLYQAFAAAILAVIAGLKASVPTATSTSGVQAKATPSVDVPVKLTMLQLHDVRSRQQHIERTKAKIAEKTAPVISHIGK